MHNQEHSTGKRVTDEQKPVFGFGVIGIIEQAGEWIDENRRRLVE